VPPELEGVEIFDLARDGSRTIWLAFARGVWTVSNPRNR
jgi:hypothetical protein